MDKLTQTQADYMAREVVRSTMNSMIIKLEELGLPTPYYISLIAVWNKSSASGAMIGNSTGINPITSKQFENMP